VDAIFHVVRAFVNKDIEHVEGDVNPTRDFEIIRAELRLKDIAWMTVEHQNYYSTTPELLL
jgi:ribosome-binding ATPase YchF (GTP1/OBG family)